MSEECKYCDLGFSTRAKLETHLQVTHRGELQSDDLQMTSEVSDGFFEDNTPEKGESFGYRK